MAKDKYSYNPITSSDVNWNEVDPSNGKKWSGKSIREFVQNRIKEMEEKPGRFYFDPITLTLYGFENAKNREEWLATGQSSLVLDTCPFPLSGTQNQIKVINEMPSGNLYFTTQTKVAMLTCSFISQEKGLTDNAWTEVAEDFLVTVFADKGSVGKFEELYPEKLVLNGQSFSFDVRNAIAVGANRVRVNVKGVESGASSQYTYTVNLTTMYLAPSNFTWYKAFVEGRGYSLGGMHIGGNLQKVMRIKVTKEETYLKEYEVNIGTAIYDTTEFTFNDLEFPTAGTGVYNVELWLDANGLESEHLTYNIICVSKKDEFTAQLVSLSEAPDVVFNFGENRLFDYSIYNCGLDKGSPTISLDTIVNTNKVNLLTETLQDVKAGAALSYTAALEVETEESKLQLSATMTYGNSQQIVYPIDNSKSYPASGNAIFYLNPSQRSNAQEDRESIVNSIDSTKYNATWTKMAWTDGMDGWTVDDNNRKCLLIPAYSKVEIDYKPLDNVLKPTTIEFVYKVKNASDYNDPVIYIGDVFEAGGSLNPNFTGIKITPKNICAQTRNLKDASLQDYNTEDEKVLDVVLTIVPQYKTTYGALAQMYVNGTKVRSFSFTGLTEWSTSSKIVMGNNTSDLYLYKMRVYEKGFDKNDARMNFVNSLPTTAEKEAMNAFLYSVTDDSMNLGYETCVKNGKNTMVIEMLEGKDIPSKLNQEEGLMCNLQINIHNFVEGELDEEMRDLLSGVLIKNQVIEGQGTTAMTYGRWNFRWKLDSNYGKRRITAKKNVASSMHSHKMGSTRIFNYLHTECVGANEANAKVAVLQYPVYGFQKVLSDDGKSYTYRPIGLYTIGADKGDNHTFGYDKEEFEDTLIHMEGSDHTPKSVGFDYPWAHTKFVGKSEAMGAINKDGSIVGAWEVGAAGPYDTDTTADEGNVQTMLNREFKPAYDVAYVSSPYILGVSQTLAEINANIEGWRAQYDANGNSYEDLEFWNKTTYDLYFYNRATEKYESTGINLLTQLGFTKDELSALSLDEINNLFITKRKEFFSANWTNYWHKDDAIFHYVFCLLFAATDNYKKNTYPYKFKNLADGGLWRWRADDLDTIFDINNQGLAAKLYSVLVGDKTSTGTGSIYRGDNSVFWTLIRETQQTEIRAMAVRIFDAMVSHPKAQGKTTLEKLVGCIKYFYWQFAQEYFPQSAYNSDTEWTYEDVWADKSGNSWKEVNPLSQALGGHYEAERDWVTMRMLFAASYFNYGPFTASGYGDSTTGQIAYGGAGAHTYEITPAIDINPTIIRGSEETITYGDRVKANTTVPLAVSNTSGADTRIYVQGLDWIKDLGDLSNLQVSADNPQLSVSSKRLQTLKVGDVDASKVTSNIKNLDFGACPSMMLVDAQNLTTLVGNVDLSQLPRLQEALFGGTSLATIQLPSGAKISRLQLPDTLTELTLSNLKFLTREGLEYESLDKIGVFKVENCEQLNPFEMMKAIYQAGYGDTTTIRLVGFIYDGDANDIDMLANMAKDLGINGEPHAYNGHDGENTTSVPVIEGTININGALYEDTYLETKANYPGIIMNATGGFYMRFADDEVKRVLLANGVGDGVGITADDAAAVTSIAVPNSYSWFQNNTNITSFNEFEKFTGVTELNGNSQHAAFSGCTNLGEITLPKTIKKIGWGSFRNCTSLKTKLPESITTIGSRAFQDSGLDGDLYLPNLSGELSREGPFNGTKITSISSLGKVTALGGWASAKLGAFYACTSLESAILPDTLLTLGEGPFFGCSSLRTCVIPQSVTSIQWRAFYGCTSLEIDELSLPNLTTLGQDAFYGVKIKKISDLGKLTALPSATASTQNFGDKSVLEEVVLPETLTSIGANSLRDYPNLTSIGSGVLNNVSSIGANSFYNIPNVKQSVTFNSLTTIASSSSSSSNRYAFNNCGFTEFHAPLLDLSNVNLYTSGHGIFMNCPNLKVIEIGATTLIPLGFARNCPLLESVTDFSSVVTIQKQAFMDTPSLEIDLVLPSCESIEASGSSGTYSTFHNCGILSLDAPKLTSLGEEMYGTYPGPFYNCQNLHTIKLQDIATIGMGCFQNCPKLKTVIINNPTPPSMGTNCFIGSHPDLAFYVPDASVTAYQEATNWSQYSDRIKPLSDYYMAQFPNHISDIRTSLVCWYNTKVEGATNASLQTGGLKDLSGNGYNLSMSGFEYTEESGIAADGGIVFSGAQQMDASGLPILTDFTVVAKRKWVAGSGAFASKVATYGSWNAGAFAIERNASGSRQESFSQSNTITRYSDDIIWMTPTSYCGTKMQRGTGADGPVLRFGNTYDYGSSYWSGSLYSFALFNRTLTDGEIEWVKNNMM